ncbi:MAG: hypothetical protein ACC656_03190, partial [Candidatus Heimdallarchaeota archaeon]
MTSKNDYLRFRVIRLERLLSKSQIRIVFEALIIITFFSFVLLPPLNLLRNIIIDWDEIDQLIFNDPILKNTVWIAIFRAIALSFRIAFIVTIIDVIIGVPIAHVLANYEFKGKTALDTIIDIPLAVPTSALGFSVLLFWASGDGISRLFFEDRTLVQQGPMLLILGHVAFSFSYVVRNLKGVLEEVDKNVV